MSELKAAIFSAMTEASGSVLYLCEQFAQLEGAFNERGQIVQNLVAENEALKARVAELEAPPAKGVASDEPAQ